MAETYQPPVEIRLLGAFGIRLVGQPLEERAWRGRKAQQLLKLLAVTAGHQLHREQIVEQLWPQLDPESAENQLHKAIHAARRALEPDLAPRAESRFLLVADRVVVLATETGIEIDADRFERDAEAALLADDAEQLERATAGYGGDLLPGELYEDWTVARRTRLASLYEQALARLGELQLEAGGTERAASAFSTLLARDATNERAHRGLMVAAALAGDRHRALQQYRVCEETLERELDVSPSDETIALLDRVERGDLARVPSPKREEPDEPRLPVTRALELHANRHRAAAIAIVAVVILLIAGAITTTADRLLGTPDVGAAHEFVALRGTVDDPAIRVFAVDSPTGWAVSAAPDGSFVLPGVAWEPGRAYDLFLWHGVGTGRIVTVSAPATRPESGVVDAGALVVDSGRPAAADAVSGLDVAGSIHFDEENRDWYDGVFQALTVHATSDVERVDALFRFVSSRFTDSKRPRLATSPRETIENGSRNSGPLTLAMAALASAGGYDVRLVDMTAPGAFTSHTTVEVFYDNDWHLYDPAYASLAYNTVGAVASYDDLRRFPELLAQIDLAAVARPGWRTDEVRRYYASGVHRVSYVTGHQSRSR